MVITGTVAVIFFSFSKAHKYINAAHYTHLYDGK
ncbi:Uncharacterised protein [Klebsiella pneumoniae]|nr:Uncharacterised protein [Klebsiella pneumoniae]